MEYLNDIISKCSFKIFDLTNEEYRILKYLAENNTLSLTEIGEKTKSYTYSFDRWGAKLRFYESYKNLGLITYDYVYKKNKNKKESRYGLTLKGLLSVMSIKKFEKISIVKRYEGFLQTFTDDKNIIKYGMDFIKFEIALILYYNYTLGLNWKRFRFLESYWNEYKMYDSEVIKKFFQNKFLNNISDYKWIKSNYIKLFYVLDNCTSYFKCIFNTQIYDGPVEIIDESIRKYIDRWYLFIANPDIDKKSLYKKWKNVEVIPSFNQKTWNEETNRHAKDAHKILQETDFIRK